MTLGEWLDEVVADQAAEQGVDPDDLDRDERLDAIGARLDRLSRREEPQIDRSRRRRHRDDLAEETRARRPSRQTSADDARLADELLEAAIGKFENRAAQSEERTARALGSVATWIERSHDGRREEREALDAVADRLDSIEERIAKTQARLAAHAAPPTDKVEKRIEETARSLDERMNELARRIEAGEKARTEVPRPVVRPRLDVVDAVSQIARRREELDARAAVSAGEPAKAGWRNFGVDAPAAAPAPVRPRAPGHEVSDAPRPAVVAEIAPRAAATEGLQVEIRKLSQRLDELRRESSERRETPRVEIEALRAELAAMSRSLADLAPRNAVVGIEGAIRDLTQRVATSRDSGAFSGLLAPIEGMINELRASLRAHDPRPAAQALEREIRAINEKIDHIAQSAINPKALERIRQQSEEVRNLLAEAALRPVPVDRLERQISDLADRVDRMNSSSTPHADTAHVAALLSDARALVERSTSPAALTAIERRLEQLAARMDQALERPAPAINPRALEEMSSRIESLRSSIEARPTPQVDMRALDAALRELGAKLESPARSNVDVGALEALMREINTKLSLQDNTAPDHAALERIVQELGARIDRRTNPVIDTAPLEQVLRSLGDRPVEVDTGPLEAMMRELGAKLERAPSVAIDTKPLEEMMREFGSRLATAQPAAIDLAPLERMMRDFGAKLEDAQAAALDTRRLEGLMQDVSARLDRPAPAAFDGRRLEDLMHDVSAKLDRPAPGAFDAHRLEGFMQDVAAKLDRPSAAAFDPHRLEDLIHDVSAKLDRPALAAFDSHALDAHRLEGFMQDVAAKLDRPSAAAFDPHRLEDLIHDVSAKLDRPAPATFDSHALESMLYDLGARIDQRSNPVIDTQPLEQTLRALHDKLDLAASPKLTSRLIEQAVDSLAQRLDAQRLAGAPDSHEIANQIADIHDRLGALQTAPASNSALEQMVGELLGELDRTRKALQVAAVPAGAPAPALDPHIVESLADLRVEQTNTDRRVQATLTGVQDVLEKLVDRIGQIEDDVANVSHAAPLATSAPVAAPAPSRPSTPPPVVSAAAALNSIDSEYREAPIFAPARPLVDTGHEPPAKTVRAATAASSLRSLDGSDFLIEPGAGATPRGLEKAVGEGAPKSAINAHIAAARRAAQAALAESAAKDAEDASRAGDGASSTARSLEQAKAFFAGRRRPILLGAALLAIVVTLAALGIGALRQPNLHKAEMDAPAAPKVAKADDTAPPKADARVIDPSPVGSINPKSPVVYDSAKPSNPAPRELVASLPSGVPSGLRDAAADGDPAAQYELALRLVDGRGLTRDPHAASQWLERAAIQGLAPAQYRLGSLYEKGVGVPRDVAIAKSWYKKAADAGNARAMHNLAVLSAETVGIKPDYTEAAEWFSKAAQFGVKDSQYNLAILYARGMGVPQDLGQSWLYFSLAAQQGDADAGKKRDEVAAKMDAKALEAASSALSAFHVTTPNAAANEVSPPPGGWDAFKSGQAAPVAPASKTQATNAMAPGKSATAL